MQKYNLSDIKVGDLVDFKTGSEEVLGVKVHSIDSSNWPINVILPTGTKGSITLEEVTAVYPINKSARAKELKCNIYSKLGNTQMRETNPSLQVKITNLKAFETLVGLLDNESIHSLEVFKE